MYKSELILCYNHIQYKAIKLNLSRHLVQPSAAKKKYVQVYVGI